MANVLNRYLEKATFTTSDLSGGSNGGLLSPDQAAEFLRIAIAESVLMREARIETSNSTKFEVPSISFASRILRKGTEATRLVDGSRVKPTTGLVTLSTYLFRGEVFVSDETFEDQVEQEGLADTLMTMIGEAVSRDIEELALVNNTARDSGDTSYAEELDQFEGLVKQFVGVSDAATTGIVIPTGQLIADASTYTSFDALFEALFELLPSQYRRNMPALRIYCPIKLRDRYHASLAARGTNLGDTALTENLALKWRGIPVVGIPMLTGNHDINNGDVNNMNYDGVVFITDPKNIIFGFHRKIRIEKWRDPRDAATSFLPSVRFDVKIADPMYGVAAKKVTGL
jgi:hypothetical protein